MLKKLLLIVLISLFSFFFSSNIIPSAYADTSNLSDQQLFESHCAGCHVNGGNIIRRGKNLKMKALHKYGYDSVETIAQIVSQGKNNMSAFSDRLSEQEIEKVAKYVLLQAENNWQS